MKKIEEYSGVWRVWRKYVIRHLHTVTGSGDRVVGGCD